MSKFEPDFLQKKLLELAILEGQREHEIAENNKLNKQLEEQEIAQKEQ